MLAQTFVGRNVRTQHPNIFAGLHFLYHSNSNSGSLFYTALSCKKFYRIGPWMKCQAFESHLICLGLSGNRTMKINKAGVNAYLYRTYLFGKIVSLYVWILFVVATDSLV